MKIEVATYFPYFFHFSPLSFNAIFSLKKKSNWVLIWAKKGPTYTKTKFEDLYNFSIKLKKIKT